MTQPRESAGQRLEVAARANRQQAVQRMAQLTGNVSACVRGRRGEPFPAFKYAEGEVAALGELLRLAQTREPAAALAECLTAWRGRAADSATKGRDWQAYYAGAIEALEALTG